MGLLIDTDVAETVLRAAVFYANQATLSLSLQTWPDGVRDIYTSEGLTSQKPKVAHSSIIILSTLLLIEVAGLVGSPSISSERQPGLRASILLP